MIALRFDLGDIGHHIAQVLDEDGMGILGCFTESFGEGVGLFAEFGCEVLLGGIRLIEQQAVYVGVLPLNSHWMMVDYFSIPEERKTRHPFSLPEELLLVHKSTIHYNSQGTDPNPSQIKKCYSQFPVFAELSLQKQLACLHLLQSRIR